MSGKVKCDHAGKPRCNPTCQHRIKHDFPGWCEVSGECWDEDTGRLYARVRCVPVRRKR